MAVHLNMGSGPLSRPGPGERPMNDAEEKYWEWRDWWQDAEGGYGHIQGTKPQTLSYGLNDSPAGLGRLDRGEVQGLDHPRRQPGRPFLQGRSAHQHHHLLGDADHRLLRAVLLREPEGHEGGREDHGAHLDGHLPQRDQQATPGVGRALPQHPALDRDAPWRATSPPWRSRRCWQRIYAPPSAP